MELLKALDDALMHFYQIQVSFGEQKFLISAEARVQ